MGRWSGPGQSGRNPWRTWKLEELDKFLGQPWDPSMTLTYEKLAADKHPKIEEPGVAKDEDIIAKPQPHRIMQADLKKAGGWTPGCRKCQAIKSGDPNQRQLTHNEECRTRVVEALVEDENFKLKMQKALERKQRFDDEVEMKDKAPRAQVGGSSSSGGGQRQEYQQQQSGVQHQSGVQESGAQQQQGGQIVVPGDGAEVDLDIPMAGEDDTNHLPQPVKREREGYDQGDGERLGEGDVRAQVGGGGGGGAQGVKREREGGDQGDEERLRGEEGWDSRLRDLGGGVGRNDGDGDHVMAVDRNSPKGGDMMWSRYSHHRERLIEPVHEVYEEVGA